MNNAKDLTKEAPRSPYEQLHGFAILPRTIDKCRAFLNSTNGEYHFDCPVDNVLFSFKGITGEDFKNFVATGASDDQIGDWVASNGISKTPEEIKAWSDAFRSDFSYAHDPEKSEWFRGECTRLGLNADTTTLFDMLEVDDKASFQK